MSTPQDQREPLPDTSEAAMRQREALANPGEALSAMIDGECDELEVRRQTAHLLDDPEWQATWRRYALVGAVLRGELATRDAAPAARMAEAADAAARLRSAIAREPVRQPAADIELPVAEEADAAARSTAPGADSSPPVPVRAAPARTRWYTAGIGLATAAGLAGGLWIGTLAPGAAQSPVMAANEGQAAPAADAREAAAGVGTSFVPAAGVRAALAPGGFDAQRRARTYMLMHAQQAGFSEGAQGTALIKLVSHEQQ